MLPPYLDDGDVQLYVGDARDVLPWLEAESVDAVVTSPPFADARADVPAPTPEQFEDWLAPILGELRRVILPRGSMMLNLGRRFRDGRELDYVERTLLRAERLGWHRIDTLIWWKPNAPARSGPYLTNAHEYVYWLAPSTDAYRGLDDARAPYSPATLGRYGRRWARNTRVKGSHVEQSGRDPHPLGARPTSVLIETVGREKGNPHPSPMPEAIAADLIALSCPSGGVVLDPFAGSGTTLRAARKLERRAVGIEIDIRWAAAAAARLGQQVLPLAADG